MAEFKKRAARLLSETSHSDFPGGDSFFLALLANPDRFRSPNSTTGVQSMIEREIENRTSLILDPSDGRIPPLTSEAWQRRDDRRRRPDGREDLDAGHRCLTYGVPRLGSTNNQGAGPMGYYQIVQVPGYVVLMTEVIHEARIIPLDNRSHLPETIRLWSGDSRGRWDGSTLVVETTNFSASADFMGSAENRRVRERFTRTAPDTINYEISISDPTTWTRPWTAMIRLKQRDDRLYEYACHEGNYVVMQGILLGARDAENPTRLR